jgi:hypothetical protein
MNRVTMFVVVAAIFIAGSASAQPPDCPWKFVTGHWKSIDSTGSEAEVVWKTADGDSLIGLWDGEDGKAMELVGWRSDTKEFVATGYGPKGEYWEVVFTTVTEKLIRGRLIHRTPEGDIRLRIFQLTKNGDDEMPTLFVGTRNGKKVTEKGRFVRVK